MRERIFGLEDEWLSNKKLPGSNWSDFGQSDFDSMVKIIAERYGIRDPRCADIFIPNGARICRESIGDHLETSSWECNTARQAVIFERWADRFIRWLTKELSEREIGDFRFNKKSSDANLAHSRGCHENYLSEKMFGPMIESSMSVIDNPDKRIDSRMNYFSLFFITRQIITGSGGIMLYSRFHGRDRYEISPRTYFINKIFSTRTTEPTAAELDRSPKRAIISHRSEALADHQKYHRNHIILGDSNMSDISNFLKIGMTSGVIEMIEESFWNKALQLQNPREAVELLRKISRDLTAKYVPIKLIGGECRNALEIQELFCQNYIEYLKYSGEGGEKLEVAGRWRESVDLLKTDDEKVYRQLDWKIKQGMIHRYSDAHNWPLAHPKVKALDFNYHSPYLEDGLYYFLKDRKGAHIESLVTDGEIGEANQRPPADNRARLRIWLQRLMEELNLSYSVHWEYVNFVVNFNGELASKKLNVLDPFSSSILQLNVKDNREAIAWINSLKLNAIDFGDMELAWHKEESNGQPGAS